MADNYTYKDAAGNTLTHASKDIGSGVQVSKHLLVDDAGVALAKAEDESHGSGDKGFMLLAVRKDTAAALGADGDYVPLLVDDEGRLYVASSNDTPPGRAAAAASMPVALSTEDNDLLAALSSPQFLTQIARIVGDDASHQLIGAGADTGVPEDYQVTADTILNQQDPTYNYGATTQLIVGYRTTGWRRALVQADFAALTDTVLQASLFLYHKNDAVMTANQNIQAHRVLAANTWVEGAKNGAAGTGTDPTWNKRSVSPDANWDGSAGLNTSGTDHSATLAGETTVLDEVAGWIEIALDVAEFDLMVADNNGLLLSGEFMNDGRIAYFHSSEYTTDTALRPYFRVWTPASAATVKSLYLIADGAGATWSNGGTATANDAPIPTSGITVPAITGGDVILSVYTPSGVNVWWAAIG